MIILKIKFHIKSFILKNIYKIMYINKVKFGANFSFRDGFHLFIEKKGKVSIGDNVFFNNYCSINSHQSVKIGDNCIFGENVKIYDHNHQYRNNEKTISRQGFVADPVVIGNNCWISSNCIILKGTTVGNNCIVGAGVIVYKSIPDNTILINKQDIKSILC